MYKNIFLSFLFLIATTAGATVPYMTRGDYVHWPEDKKEEFHIKVMELMVQLESRYNRDTAKYGYSEERYQRYVQILKSLQSQLLISSAYADATEQSESDVFVSLQQDVLTHRNKQRNIDWNGMAVAFKVLSSRSTNNGDGNCIFGGWISQVRKVRDQNGNVRTVCAHPNFVAGAGKVTMENVNYPDAPGNGPCSKNDRKNIQCNPLVFGYKNADKKELFCVPTSRNAENSSFQCMQQALSETPRVGVDSREKRMQYLKDRYASSENAVDVFNTVFMFNYKTCVCADPQSNFSREYQNYMRPSPSHEKTSDRYRTCYGLMKMMKEAVNECSLPIGTNGGIFTAFDEFLKEKHTLTSDPAGTVADAWYSEFITRTVRTSKPAIEAYNQICSDQLDVPQDPTTDTPVQTQQDSGPAKEYECKADCKFPAEGETTALTCTYVVNEKGKEEKIEGAKPEKEPATKEDKFVMVKSDKLPAEGVRCEIPWPEAQATEGPEPTIEISITNRGNTHYDVAAETTNADGWTIKWRIEDPNDAKPEEGWNASSSNSSTKKSDGTKKSTPIKGMGGDSAPTTPTTPPASAPAPSSDETPPATTDATTGTSESTGTATQTTGADATSGSAAQTTSGDETSGTASTTASTSSGSSGGSSDTPATAGRSTASTPSAGSGPTGAKEIKQKRAEKDYQVCADLVKGDKVVKGNCVTIDKVIPETPAAAPRATGAGFGGQQPQMPQTPVRGSSDTSAMGIR